MKYLFILLTLWTTPGFTAECGCKTKIINVHEHDAMECEQDEVMVGHDTKKGVIKCGTIKCECACEPEFSQEDTLAVDSLIAKYERGALPYL